VFFSYWTLAGVSIAAYGPNSDDLSLLLEMIQILFLIRNFSAGGNEVIFEDLQAWARNPPPGRCSREMKREMA
jgi:hypothetical protein